MEIAEFLKISDLDKCVESICDFLKKEIDGKFQRKGAVIGLSGGIDSAVTAALCSKSIGSQRVIALIMPEKESDPNSEKIALNVANKFNIKIERLDITNILESFGVYAKKEKIVKERFHNFNDQCKYRVVIPSKLDNKIGFPILEVLDEQNIKHKIKISTEEFLSLTAATSIKHRVRMTILYYFGEKTNSVIVGTTNKSEYLQGYFVKYGDGGSDIEPLVNLYKSQIYELGEFLDIPNEILSKDASPDVWSYSTNDEEFFYSVPYSIVDLILYAREKNLDIKQIENYSNLSREDIKKLLLFQNQKQNKSQHMREIPHDWKPFF